jgi:hypothetical protein
MDLCFLVEMVTFFWGPSILAAFVATVIAIRLQRRTATALLWSSAASLGAALLWRPDRLRDLPSPPGVTITVVIGVVIWTLCWGGFAVLFCSGVRSVARWLER